MEAKVARAYYLVVLLVLFGAVLSSVEAKSCCIDSEARFCFNACRGPPETCARLCGCKIITGSTCPRYYPDLYCTLGCESSQCSTIAAPANSDGGDTEAARCKNACSELCSNGYSKQVSSF